MQLKTDRLYIRNLCENDWPEMKKIWLDFNHSEYAVYDMPLPTEDAEVRALTKRFADSNLFFAVFLSDKMIGYMGFHKVEDKFDLGYCFHSAYHHNGYAYESAKALIEYFIKEYNATGFTAGTSMDNQPSCELLKKLGFLCTSIETISFDGEFSFQGGNFTLDIK